jgi:Domain of unknown function (DUF4258)
MINQQTRPPKIGNLISAVKRCLELGNYRRSVHARRREKERDIDLTDIKYVLKNGRHEGSKDQFDDAFNAWKYAIRGKTLDGADIRIIVAFDENIMHIITVISLTEG